MHFVYKLIPPRPTFATDMTAEEGSVMASHAAYWHQQVEEGRVVVFGPVADPSGVWGLGILDVDNYDAATALIDADPAISSRLGTFELHAMDATVRGHDAAAS